MNLIHRRDGFSGAESSVQKVKELNDHGKLNLYTKYQMDSVIGNNPVSYTHLTLPTIYSV